jgi:NAD+ kinase
VILKKIAIFQNTEYDKEYIYTKRAVRVLSGNRISSYLSESARPYFENESLDVKFFENTDQMMEEADAVLVLGGDGTMIGYSVLAAKKGKPVIGVNLGHLGFLTALERGEIPKLSALANGDFTVEERMLLEAEISLNGEIIHSQQILNDIAITSGVRSKIGEFSLSAKTGGLLEYRADGVIVATPTGSTAYSFSAGGPIIEPTASILSVTPICPHSLYSRPLIFPDCADIEIKNASQREKSLFLTIDGRINHEMFTGERIRVTRSKLSAGFIRLKDSSFYERLRQKMNDR